MRSALACAVLGFVASIASAAPGPQEPWRTEVTVDGSAPQGGHEVSAVAVDGTLYLMGGRGERRVDAYDPEADTWTALGPMPTELHHFQPVAIGTEIWVAGAFTGGYPNETAVAEVRVYDTASGTWRIAFDIPENRRRGSAAAVLHDDGLVYVLGGNTAGHAGGAVAWLDRFDPVTGVWEALPDAPRARDHFAAAILDGRLVAAGGRTTEQPNPFLNTVAVTDVYSFATGTWNEAADIPTPRAGAFTAGHDGELVVVGGEVNDRSDALAVAEAFDVDDGTWRTLQPLNVGRHSGGAAVLGDRLHVVAGSDKLGGADTADHESLGLETDGPAAAVDSDADGLSDEAEAELGTNPTVADTDGDGRDDGAEVGDGTDPLAFDAASEEGTVPVQVDNGVPEPGPGDGEPGTGDGGSTSGGGESAAPGDGPSTGSDADVDGDGDGDGVASGGGGGGAALAMLLCAIPLVARRRTGTAARGRLHRE